MEIGISQNDLASLERHIEPFGVVHLARLALVPMDPLEMETPLAHQRLESPPPHSTGLGFALLRERYFERATRPYFVTVFAVLGCSGRLCATHPSKECQCIDRLVHIDLLLWLRFHHLGSLAGHANGLAVSTCKKCGSLAPWLCT